MSNDPGLALRTLSKKLSKNMVGKWENTGNIIFSFFHYVFYPFQNKFQISVTFDLSSANALNFNHSKFFFSLDHSS